MLFKYFDYYILAFDLVYLYWVVLISGITKGRRGWSSTSFSSRVLNLILSPCRFFRALDPSFKKHTAQKGALSYLLNQKFKIFSLVTSIFFLPSSIYLQPYFLSSLLIILASLFFFLTFCSLLLFFFASFPSSFFLFSLFFLTLFPSIFAANCLLVGCPLCPFCLQPFFSLFGCPIPHYFTTNFSLSWLPSFTSIFSLFGHFLLLLFGTFLAFFPP